MGNIADPVDEVRVDIDVATLGGPLDAVPIERLEEEMRSLAGHIAAATASFLALVGEYDAREGWRA